MDEGDHGVPVLINASGSAGVAAEIVDALRFVLSSSDGILAQTPVENLRAYFKAAKEYGVRNG